MKTLHLRPIVTLAILPAVVLAANVAFSAAPVAGGKSSAPAPIVSDVALQDGGMLVGQIMSPQGTPRAAAPVKIMHQGVTVATTSTDAQGRFAINNLRGGVHQIESAEGRGIYRFWAARTAPPAARQGVLMVEDGAVVRANDCPPDNSGLKAAAVFVGVSAGIIAATDNHKSGS